MTGGPAEFSKCQAVYAMGTNGVAWLMHHASPTQLLVNVTANFWLNIMSIGPDAWGIATAFLGGNMYECGKDLGSLIMLLIN